MKQKALKDHTHKRQQGYTLIELLLYVAIMGTLLTTVTYFFGTVASARVKDQTVLEVNDQGVALMDYITQTIRNATSITAPTIGTTGSSLTLVVPTGALSPTVINAISLPGIIQVKEGAGAAIPLISNDVQVNSLTFKNLSRTGTPGIIQVNFVLARVNPSNMNEFDYQKSFIGTAEVAW
jgi:type II secretory pathway pseudopilin PulG